MRPSGSAGRKRKPSKKRAGARTQRDRFSDDGNQRPRHAKKKKPAPRRLEWVNRDPRRANADAPEKKSSASPISLTVVFENDQYVVLDKPALLDSQNSKPNRQSVVEWLNKKYEFSGLVHRLDFGVSGLLLAAKNSEQAADLTRALSEGKIERRYLAFVVGKKLPREGTLETPIEGKPSRTHFKVSETFKNAQLVEINLETGRKHQIRRHFADAGSPLLGDHLYGNQASKLLFQRPALHAYSLKVLEERYKIDLPADLRELLRRLRMR